MVERSRSNRTSSSKRAIMEDHNVLNTRLSEIFYAISHEDDIRMLEIVYENMIMKNRGRVRNNNSNNKLKCVDGNGFGQHKKNHNRLLLKLLEANLIQKKRGFNLRLTLLTKMQTKITVTRATTGHTNLLQ